MNNTCGISCDAGVSERKEQMKILVINSGSTSLKYQLIDSGSEVREAKGTCARIGTDGRLTHESVRCAKFTEDRPIPDHHAAMELVLQTLLDPRTGVLKDVSEIDAIGHRVLHGGPALTGAVLVNNSVKQTIRDCFELGPLHNPANLMGIEVCEELLPGKPNVAVFDTGFGMGMPEEHFLYAIPYEYYERYGIRRYGFHGISHRYVSRETAALCGLSSPARVIVCHLGGGASVSASVDGVCVDTSMGMTPVEGLIMGSRCGDIDAGVVQLLCRKEGKDIDAVMTILNKQSGLLGLSGVSAEFRDIEREAAQGNARCRTALKAFCYRIAKYIGAYAAAMNGVDAISFTAGIGENDGAVRREICSYLGYLGIRLDEEKNLVQGERRIISTEDSAVKVAAVPTDEERAIARETAACLSAPGKASFK